MTVAMALSFMVLFFFGWPTSAQSAVNPPAGAQVQAPPEITPKRGALFKIRQANHTLYLFGTIHVGSPDFYPLEPGLMRALAQSSKLALELDPLTDPAALQKAMQQYALYPTGSDLNADLPPAMQTRLRQLLAQNGIDYQAVTQFKPWMLSIMLALGQYAAKGYQTALAVDAHLSKLAHAQHKPIVELESAAGQIGLFGKLPVADQVRMLQDDLLRFDDEEQKQLAEAIVNTWRSADQAGLEGLAHQMAADQSFSGQFFQRELLDGRNPGLADGMMTLLKSEKTSFAAIGILHLVGDGSVPAILRQRGVSVERVY
jgi:uncharacterized protein YbaP (TraB family)